MAIQYMLCAESANKEGMDTAVSLKHADIIKTLTLEEKCHLLSGRDFWSTVGLEKKGVPSICLSDGPHGLRKQEGAGDQLGLNGSLPATCFPTAATIANTSPRSCTKVPREGENAANLRRYVQRKGGWRPFLLQ